MSAPLTPADQSRAERARAAVHEHMPEILPCIRDLVGEGLVGGWRAVVYCGPIDGGPRYHVASSTLFDDEILRFRERRP